jgi:hypothetical protein
VACVFSDYDALVQTDTALNISNDVLLLLSLFDCMLQYASLGLDTGKAVITTINYSESAMLPGCIIVVRCP